jgi:hypothetical protein
MGDDRSGIAFCDGSTVGGMFLGGGLAYYFDHTLAIHADVDLVIMASIRQRSYSAGIRAGSALCVPMSNYEL